MVTLQDKSVIMMQIAGKNVYIYGVNEQSAPLIILNTFQGNGKEIYEKGRRWTDKPFRLAVIGDIEWNREMSPWECMPVFKGEKPFQAGADIYLAQLTGEIIPAIKREISAEPKTLIIAGYSLAGLFALYSLYRTDMFQGAVSASGSLWFPNFAEYVMDNPFAQKPEKVYLSLGNKEKNVKNKLMMQVENRTRAILNHYQQQGIDTVFELNPGNHFRDVDDRIAKGIVWILK
ncbi:alpha/beta hydrolase [uncultured Anaerovibrio sp.]|uniref:alpha/beta hydrolase n=1 Tax=uncultured Anaerovibrio sp. TaxID=361586 RepID=UPI0025F7BD0C|nr:alpha/beta hydrolase-fold protein [uncultured Anaerovibrio sp.]